MSCLRLRGRGAIAAVLVLSSLLSASAVALQAPSSKKQGKAEARVLLEDRFPCRWLDEDVRWISSPEEKAAFESLSNDQERDQFVESFWSRHDPTPDTHENEYKEEHYRRIAYANEHFGAGSPADVPGWRTDRGRAYIALGPPDVIGHPLPATADQSQPKHESPPSTPAEEVWTYRYRKPASGFHGESWSYGPLKYATADVVFRFVDTCRCGDYRLVLGPSDKDPFNGPYPFGKPTGPEGTQIFIGVSRPPTVKFKNLQEVVVAKLALKQVPFDVTTDSTVVTRCIARVPITIQVNNHELTFVARDGGKHATIHVFGRLISLTGRVADVFEGAVAVNGAPESLLEAMAGTSVYRTEVLLRPGRYRLDLAVEDVNGDRIGTRFQALLVPVAE